MMSNDQSEKSIEAFAKGFGVGYRVGKDISIDLLEALQDLLEDLKLRASLTDEPNVLNVSRGKLIKAEKAIAKARVVRL